MRSEENETNKQVLMPVQERLKTITGTDGIKIIDYYLIDEITGVGDYLDFLREVESARDCDIIRVHIDSVGGLVHTGLQLRNALLNTNATVNIYVEGQCLSAATYVMLAGDYIEFAPFSIMMIHAMNYGSAGKFNDVKSHTKFTEPWFEDMTQKIYKDFLTNEEIERVLKGEELWFSAEDAQVRIDKKVEKNRRISSLIDAISEKWKKKMSDEIDTYFDENGEISDEKLAQLEKKYLKKIND